MNYPLISVITVSYNAVLTIEQTILSVINQTYLNIEYIIIDGGSTDGTVNVIKKYADKIAYWVSESDKGIYDAMNKGIRMATGDVVGILNSDDFYTDENVLQTVADNFMNYSVDAVYGDIHFVHDADLGKCVRYYSSRLFSPFWLRFGFMPAHPSFYCKREVFDKAGLYSLDYKIGADYEMMVRLFRKYGISSRYISKDFVTMRTGGASNRYFRNRLTLIREDVKACRDNGIYTNSFLVSLKFLYKIFEFRVF